MIPALKTTTLKTTTLKTTPNLSVDLALDQSSNVNLAAMAVQTMLALRMLVNRHSRIKCSQQTTPARSDSRNREQSDR